MAEFESHHLHLGPSHDSARYRPQNRMAIALVVLGVGLLMGRLVLVQAVRGERYEQYAAIERVSKVQAQAPRGLIRGSDGAVLARNIESHRLELLTHRIRPDRIRPIADSLRELLDVTDSEYRGLIADLGRPVEGQRQGPLVVRRGLVSTYCPYDSARLDLVGEADYAFCPTCGRTYEPPPKGHSCPVDRRKLVPSGNGNGLHCHICAREFLDGDRCPYDDTDVQHRAHVLRCPMCGRTFNDEVALIKAHLHQLPEARVRTEIQREYPLRFLASHVLGYVSQVSARDRRPLKAGDPPRFDLNDRIGRAGVERAVDSLLRGVDGEQVLVRRGGTEEQARGLDELIEVMRPRPTTAGLSVRLTLDLQLQRDAKVALAHVHSGAVVALNAKTGAVLVMYSKPSFDPNVWSGRLTAEQKARTDASPFAPMMNKAVRAFPPASVYKVVAAAGALEEGLVTPQTSFHCPGWYEFGGRRFRCHKRTGHGDVELTSALEQSCDVYFYRVGELLGIDRLAKYALQMGFGAATGVEIYESNGHIPTRAWYEDKRKGSYLPGFALSTAVGQKDATATPLQVARVFAGIARDGLLPPVHLIESFDAANDSVPVGARRPAEAMKVSPGTIRSVQAGLYAVVNGTAGTARGSSPEGVTMVGKTGTAEAAQRADPDAPPEIVRWFKDNHAWFVGYAPAEDPEIVVVVFVEHGGGGGHIAAPVVKRLIERWFSRPKQARKLAELRAKSIREGHDRDRRRRPTAATVQENPALNYGPSAPTAELIDSGAATARPGSPPSPPSPPPAAADAEQPRKRADEEGTQ